MFRAAGNVRGLRAPPKQKGGQDGILYSYRIFIVLNSGVLGSVLPGVVSNKLLPANHGFFGGDGMMEFIDRWTLYFLTFVAGYVLGAMIIPAIKWGWGL